MTPAARKRQFVKLEQAVLYARRGHTAAAMKQLCAERLADLRAVADRTRDGWVPPAPAQGDMFSGRSP